MTFKLGIFVALSSFKISQSDQAGHKYFTDIGPQETSASLPQL